MFLDSEFLKKIGLKARIFLSGLKIIYVANCYARFIIRWLIQFTYYRHIFFLNFLRNDLFNIVIIELESVHFFDSKKRFCSQKLY